MAGGFTTGDDINAEHEEKQNGAILDIAKKLFKDMGIKAPDIPVCYLHKMPFSGNFVQYTTKDRQVVPVCIPCVSRLIDKAIDDYEKGI